MYIKNFKKFGREPSNLYCEILNFKIRNAKNTRIECEWTRTRKLIIFIYAHTKSNFIKLICKQTFFADDREWARIWCFLASWFNNLIADVIIFAVYYLNKVTIIFNIILNFDIYI